MQDPIPLVFLHGFMGTTLAHFGKIIKIWYKKLPLVCIDMPGHGQCPDNGDIDYYESTMAYVINKISKYQKVNLIGASYLGGTIALKIAHNRPDLLNKLIITGFSYNLSVKTFTAWSNNFKILVAQSSDLANEYERLHGSRWKNTMDVVINNINETYEQKIFISEGFLKKISIPTILINGDYKDNELNAAKNFCKLSPFLYSEVISGAGHIVPYHVPNGFCRAVEVFLGG